MRQIRRLRRLLCLSVPQEKPRRPRRGHTTGRIPTKAAYARHVWTWDFVSDITTRGGGFRTLYIDPGSPWQNGYVESFNSRFRDECLNGEQLYTLPEARVVISDWIAVYNEERPHGGVGYLTPNEAAARPRSSGPYA